MENIAKNLKTNPLNWVKSQKSPIGIYLRRVVFREEAEDDKIVGKELYEKIVSGQSVDGSWKQMFVPTAKNLWNLFLLGYNAEDKSVKRGLEWLLGIQRKQYRGYPGFFSSKHKHDARLIRSTFYGEFGPGCAIFYQTTYSVHLFHVFSLGNNRLVQRAVKSYLEFWRPDYCGSWCTINVLRVLIEHPLSAKSKLVENGLEFFSKRQSNMGSWSGFPFFHVFHALSRSDMKLAKKQVEKASPLIIRRQNKDGSWGRKFPETESFLVLDGLKNIGAI